MFVHLHSHLIGSHSDCILMPDKTIAWAESAGVPAHAVTDHGCLTAVYPLYLASRGSGVRPIFGCEVYFDARANEEDDIQGLDRTHLVLLAKNLKGFRNLVRITNAAWREHFREPRYAIVTWALLERHHEGLICTTACVGGPVGVASARRGRYERAEEIYNRLLDIFGEDFYPEVAGHPIFDQPGVNQAVLAYARRSGRPPILTNDCHYPASEDWFTHNIYIKTRDKNPKSFSYTATCFYLKTPDEMRAMKFPREFSDQTLRIAEGCTADQELEKRLRAGFPATRGPQHLFPIRNVTISPKMALGDAARVMRLPQPLLHEIYKDLKAARAPDLDTALRRSHRLQAFVRKFPLVWRGAKGLEGLPRYVEPDFRFCVDVDSELLTYLPIRNVDGLTVLDVEIGVLRQLGIPVRPSAKKERQCMQSWEGYFAGLRSWWNDDLDDAARRLEKTVQGPCPAQAYFRLSDSLAHLGKFSIAKHILRSLESSDSTKSKAVSGQLKRALSALDNNGSGWSAGSRNTEPVSLDHLPDFSALYLNGSMGIGQIQKAVGLVEHLLESDVGVVAIYPDRKACGSALFLPLLIGIDAFLRRYRGRVYLVGAPASSAGRLTARWFPAYPTFSDVSCEIPGDVALKPRAAPQLAFNAHRSGRSLRHSQLIRSRIRQGVLRDPGGRSWRLAVVDISGDAIRVAAPETLIVPETVRVELEIGRDVAVSSRPLPVRAFTSDLWAIDAPPFWDVRPLRVGKRKACRIPARMVSCTPGGARGILPAIVTELSLSGCILESEGNFAENESAAILLGKQEITLAAWKIRTAKNGSIWAFYDYDPQVRAKLVKSFALAK